MLLFVFFCKGRRGGWDLAGCVDVCRQPAGAQARARRAPHNAGKFKSKQLLGTVGDLVLTLGTKQ